MSKVVTVVRKEYLERVRSKSFLIGTLLGPLFMAALILGPTLLADVAGDQDRTVAVLDLSGEVQPRLAAMLQAIGADHVALAPMTCAGDTAACIDDLKAQVLAEEVDAGLLIRPRFFEDPQLVFYNTAVGTAVLRDRALQPALNQLLHQERFRREGVAPEKIAYILAGAQWSTRQLTAEAESEQHSDVGIIGGILMVMIIYFMVLVYGQQNLTVVIEEKSSRMVEVLLASLRPEQLMLGKVLGIGLAALTQVAVWTAAGLVASGQNISVAGTTIDLGMFGPWFWVTFLLFYFCGYFLYASLYAGVGAMCNSVQDAQQFAGVLTMGMVVPIMLMMLVIRAPDTTLAVVLSLIPFFSPILMFMRVSVSNPPLWQVALSLALLVGTIVVANRVAGRLFRAGILLYGSTPTWATLARALRT